MNLPGLNESLAFMIEFEGSDFPCRRPLCVCSEGRQKLVTDWKLGCRVTVRAKDCLNPQDMAPPSWTEKKKPEEWDQSYWIGLDRSRNVILYFSGGKEIHIVCYENGWSSKKWDEEHLSKQSIHDLLNAPEEALKALSKIESKSVLSHSFYIKVNLGERQRFYVRIYFTWSPYLQIASRGWWRKLARGDCSPSERPWLII